MNHGEPTGNYHYTTPQQCIPPPPPEYRVPVSTADSDWQQATAELYAAPHNTIHGPQPDNAFHESTTAHNIKRTGGGRRGSGKSGQMPMDAEVEIIICQGPATPIPSSRSTVERRYICNGQPIHRVTFWRHRKQGCPGTGIPTFTPEGFPQPQVVVGRKSKKTNTAKMDNLVRIAEKNQSMAPIEAMNIYGGQSLPAFGEALTSPAIGQSHMQITEAMEPVKKGQYQQTGVETSLPGANASHSQPQYAFLPLRQPQGQQQGPPSYSMQPFSLLTDALNLYYSPSYRNPELQDEDISSPVRASYGNAVSPLDNHSESSEFMEDRHTTDMNPPMPTMPSEYKHYMDTNHEQQLQPQQHSHDQ